MNILHRTALLGLAATLLILPPARATTILHNFTGNASDGWQPPGSVTLSGSKLYGMTTRGGSGDWGTIFSMNTDGTGFGLLHTFTVSASDGRVPYGSLTLSGSKLYGMTSLGPGGGGGSTFGTIFSMNTNGTGFALLHSFTLSASDGRSPQGSSLTLSGSKLYGMTSQGSGGAAGTVFSMNTDGTGFSLLHGFIGGSPDGANPISSLTLSGSTFYGMTEFGGVANQGTVFSMNTNGTGFSVLHRFTGATSDGSIPYGSLTLVGSKV